MRNLKSFSQTISTKLTPAVLPTVITARKCTKDVNSSLNHFPVDYGTCVTTIWLCLFKQYLVVVVFRRTDHICSSNKDYITVHIPATLNDVLKITVPCNSQLKTHLKRNSCRGLFITSSVVPDLKNIIFEGDTLVRHATKVNDNVGRVESLLQTNSEKVKFPQKLQHLLQAETPIYRASL